MESYDGSEHPQTTSERLNADPDAQRLAELSRQPGGRREVNRAMNGHHATQESKQHEHESKGEEHDG